MSFAIGPLAVLTACTDSSVAVRAPSPAASATVLPHSDQLQAAVDAVNDVAAAKGYALHSLTVAEVLEWFDDAKNFELLRSERGPAESQLRQGLLPQAGGAGQLAVPAASSPASASPTAGAEGQPVIIGSGSYGFELIGPQDSASGSAEIVITPFNLPIVDDDGYVRYERYLKSLLTPDLDLGREAFRGTPAPATDATLDPAVRVRVTPTVLKGKAKAEPAQRAALKVEIRLTADTLDGAARYFGTGFGAQAMRTRLAERLGGSGEAWVNLAEVLPNWVGDRVNTFPSGADTDVCYGAAREFYAPQQDERHNASTEASSLLLGGHYCLLGNDVAPTFGDYLSVPNQHAGRYVLRDPASGRDVSFSVQSGGNAPYRFAWLDEDFSASPFAGEPDPTVLTTRVDVWRRCR
ncbi:hypothetical protein GCM10020358_53640 [Amorphoplanes nipponensis]|uniref:Uncharacterized protein n=1 Tax=Actinoplanes nipponensis TaxID=135950 RepID=A0A919JI79_9ACTN|nr:hypothetical protein Ani05nite_08080 [Actinoplanes nipponensis]